MRQSSLHDRLLSPDLSTPVGDFPSNPASPSRGSRPPSSAVLSVQPFSIDSVSSAPNQTKFDQARRLDEDCRELHEHIWPLLRVFSVLGLANSLIESPSKLMSFYGILVIILNLTYGIVTILFNICDGGDVIHCRLARTEEQIMAIQTIGVFVNIIVYTSCFFFLRSRERVRDAFAILFDRQHFPLLESTRRQFAESVRGRYLNSFITCYSILLSSLIYYIISTLNNGPIWISFLGLVLLAHSVCGMTCTIALIFIVSRSHVLAVTRLSDLFVDKNLYSDLAPTILQHPVDPDSFLELEHIVTDGWCPELPLRPFSFLD